jgi:DNA replication protein
MVAMKKFSGFTDQETFIRVPDSFFRDLLGEIDDADELKVTLYAIWRLEHMESRVRFLRETDFSDVVADAHAALDKAIRRGSLLKASTSAKGDQAEGELYFLNSPRGRAAAEAYIEGKWHPTTATSSPPPEHPNIFTLYEENIGPLTPLLADALKDAEERYPPEWIVEAIEISVKNNKRSWLYAEAILKRWKEEGHAKEQDRRNAEGLRGRDVTRKVDEFFKR